MKALLKVKILSPPKTNVYIMKHTTILYISYQDVVLFTFHSHPFNYLYKLTLI